MVAAEYVAVLPAAALPLLLRRCVAVEGVRPSRPAVDAVRARRFTPAPVAALGGRARSAVAARPTISRFAALGVRVSARFADNVRCSVPAAVEPVRVSRVFCDAFR